MNPNAMFEKYLEYARRIRHVFDAWLLLFLCPALTTIPWIGLPLGLLCALVGAAASLRVMKEGRLLHGLILAGLFGLTFLMLPAYRSSIREQASQLSQKHATPTYQPPVLKTTEPRYVIPSQPVVSYSPPPPQHQTRTAPSHEKGLIAPLVPSVKTQAERVEKAPALMPTQPVARNLPQEADRIVGEWWNAKRRLDFESAIPLHTEPTDFCGLLVTREQLRSRLREDWTKNSNVQESLIRKPTVSEVNHQWTVACNVRFALPATGKNIPLRGQCLQTFVLTDIDGHLRIASHRETITPELHTTQAVNGMSTLLLRAALSSCLESDVAGDLNSSMCFYAPKVRYFGKVQDFASIRADKLRYCERWPIRSECFEGDLSLSAKSKTKTEATFKSRFRTESRERGEWCEGLVEHHFVFENQVGRLRIVDQSARTLESHKGTLPKP